MCHDIGRKANITVICVLNNLFFSLEFQNSSQRAKCLLICHEHGVGGVPRIVGSCKFAPRAGRGLLPSRILACLSTASLIYFSIFAVPLVRGPRDGCQRPRTVAKADLAGLAYNILAEAVIYTFLDVNSTCADTCLAGILELGNKDTLDGNCKAASLKTTKEALHQTQGCDNGTVVLHRPPRVEPVIKIFFTTGVTERARLIIHVWYRERAILNFGHAATR